MTAIAQMYLDYLDVMRRLSKGVPFKIYPTLVVIPAGLVGHTFNDVVKWFGGLIHIWCNYDTATEFSGFRQQQRPDKTHTKIRFFKKFTSHSVGNTVDHVEAREVGSSDDVDVEAEAEAERSRAGAEDSGPEKQNAHGGDEVDQGEAEEGAVDTDGDTDMSQNIEATVPAQR